MKRSPRKFLVIYIVTFALLYGLGFFVTGRHTDAGWARLPFDPHRKITPPHDFVLVYLLQADKGENIEFVTRTMWQLYDDHELYPDLYGTENYMGTVSINQSWWTRVLAPLVWRTDSVLRANVDIEPGAVIPPAVLEEAEALVYQESRLALDAPYFGEDQLDFFGPTTGTGSGNNLYLPGTTESFIPLSLIPLFFAAVPFGAAWALTATTVKAPRR